jgi:gas vesicle protein
MFLGEGDLIDLIVLLWSKSNDAVALENLMKLMLEKGAQLPIDYEKPISFALLIQNCPTSVIKMVINTGTKQQIDKNVDEANKILQRMIKESDESVKEIQTRLQKEIKEAQDEGVRYKKLMDDLKTPSTQNTTPKASNGVKEGESPRTRGPQNSPK